MNKQKHIINSLQLLGMAIFSFFGSFIIFNLIGITNNWVANGFILIGIIGCIIIGITSLMFYLSEVSKL